jgi:hypothetical protein
MKTIFLNFPELDEALKEAKKLSNKNSIVLHVIKSINDENEQVYYVDENGLIRVWEELIATFENGVKI